MSHTEQLERIAATRAWWHALPHKRKAKSMNFIHASEVNYVILTAEQFANDFPGCHSAGPVLAITNDDNELITVVVGDNAAMLAELVGDISEYAKNVADPGGVEAKVGPSHTVVPSQ